MRPLDRLQDLTRPTGQEQLLDVAYPTPRLHLSVRHAVLAALAVVAVVAVLLLVQSRAPEPVAYEPPAVEAPAESAELVVSVVGAVTEPGLLTLAPGARVHDALQQVTPLPDADLTALNLAQKLTDGQQLVVPVLGEVPAGAVAAGVSLNSATESELTSLPGVGPATAAAIIAHREASGGFGTLEQLLDVKGIGPARFESLRDQVTL